MALKQQIEQDLKASLLAGDKVKTETLRGLKSAILNVEVAKGARDTGLGDEEIQQILSKESKKRQESADLYRQGGDESRASAELNEKAMIDGYLPKQLSEEELGGIIDDAIKTTGAKDKQSMGQVIGIVKQKAGAAADGATVARLVQERLK